MRVLPWARTHAAKLSSCGMGRFCLSFLSLADSFGVAATHSTTCPLMHLSVLACSCSQTCISVRVCVGGWGAGKYQWGHQIRRHHQHRSHFGICMCVAPLERGPCGALCEGIWGLCSARGLGGFSCSLFRFSIDEVTAHSCISRSIQRPG